MGTAPHPAGPGRPKGSLNKSTREIRELAQQYGPEAIYTLVKLMRKSDNEQVVHAAAKELLVRGYGNALTISGPNDGPIPVTYEGISVAFGALIGEILGEDVKNSRITDSSVVQ